MTFALDAAADVTAQATWQVDHWAVQLRTPAGEAAVALRIAGRHNVKNALAATASALAAGIALPQIAAGLSAFEPVKGRSQVRPLSRDGVALTLIDDTYNANPDSVRAAIDVLAALPAPRWLVLGDMGEVGEQGPLFHAEVGAYAHAQHLDQLWCLGTLCRHTADACGGPARHFENMDALLAALASERPAFASVLVKGSRFMRMERVVAALQAAQTGSAIGPQANAEAARAAGVPTPANGGHHAA
jgi:UDP-N-acetylmuramoyl-tripeptide--D-alanyl-D-alanine ligase